MRECKPAVPGLNRVLKNSLCLAQGDEVSKRDARRRSATGWGVQLYQSGAAGAAGSSLAGDSAPGGRGAEPVVNPVRPVVRVHGTAVDSPGEAVAGAAAAGAVRQAQRAAADGGAGL